MIGISNDETNFPHKLLLANTQVSKIRKAFVNGSLANIKFWKTQLSKMLQSGVVAIYELTRPVIEGLESMPKFFDNKLKNILRNKDKISDTMKTIDNSIKRIKSIKKRFGALITLTDNEIKDTKLIKSLENRAISLKGTARKITSQEGGFLNFLRPLMTAGLPLMKSVLTPFTKNVLLPFGLSAGMSAADAAVQKKICGSGTATSIIWNEEMEDTIKIVKSHEESGLLIKGEIIKNEAKEQKGGFFPMLLKTLTASIRGSALTGRGVIRAGERTIKACKDF